MKTNHEQFVCEYTLIQMIFMTKLYGDVVHITMKGQKYSVHKAQRKRIHHSPITKYN